MANKRGGLSEREYKAAKAGVAVDYSKSAKQQAKAAPRVVAPQKPAQKGKVVYDLKNGVAKVVTPQPKPVYGPAMPKDFKSQFSAVKNYSQAKSTPKNFSTPPKNYSSVDDTVDEQQTRKDENLKKSVAEAQRAREEADKAGSIWGMTKNTVKGLFKKDTYKKAATKEGLKEGFKAVGKAAYSIPQFAAREGISAALSTKYGQKTLGGRINPDEDFGSIGAKIIGEGQIGGWQQRTEKVKKIAQEGIDFNKAVFGKEGKTRKLTEGQSKFAAPLLVAGSVFSNVFTGGKGKVVKGAVEQAGKDAIESTTKKGVFENLGKHAVSEGKMRSGITDVAAHDKVAAENFSRARSRVVPNAKAAEFPEGKMASTIDDAARQADEAAPVTRSTRKVGEDINEISEAPAPKEKPVVNRNHVAALNESTDRVRAKVSQALEDAKNQVDEFDVDGKPIPKKNPMDDVNAEIENLKKQFEDATGEKAPDDIDELVGRIKAIEGENKGAWMKQDKEVTRGKNLASKAGVRPFTPSVRGRRKGILVEARARKLAEKERLNAVTESAKEGQKKTDKALRDSLDEYAQRLEKKIDSKNFSGPDEFERVHLEYKSVDNALKRLDQGKLPAGERPRIHEFLKRRGIDVSKRTVPEAHAIELSKKGDGAVRETVPVNERATLSMPQEATLPRPAFSKNGEKIGSENFNGEGQTSLGKQVEMVKQQSQGNPGLPATPSASPQLSKSGAELPGGELKLSKIPNTPKDRLSWFKELGTRTQETLQDNWVRVKKLVENPDVKVDPNQLNPYEAETLFHGRVGHRIEQANETVSAIDKEIATAEKALKNPNLKSDIDKYLVAKHAPERNAVHGDGAAGMTNEEAAAIVEDLGKNKDIVALSSKVKALGDQTLEILHDSQVIDDETYKSLRETYKDHVPLNRVFNENEDMGQVLAGRGFDVRSSGIKRAKGSQLEVADIMTNITANLEQAIVRAEKNRVDLSTLRFARDNNDLGMFTEIKPKAIGQTFDGKPILQRIDDPLVLTVRENGKPVYLRINDEKMATVFKGIGNEKLPQLLSFVNWFTRTYSGLATRFNPEFALSNKLRDLQEMAVFMSSQKGVGFSGAGKTTLRDTSSMKDVLAHMRGKDTPGTRLYKQMMEDGGTTGGQSLSTRKQVELDIDAIRRLNRGGILNMRQQGKKIINAFDSWNQIFEDSTRLSVYKTALEKGISRDKAAILAKNSTINFNKKGTSGPIINSLYMFSNASIQGSAKLIRAMKDPKTAVAVTATVGSSVWATNSWNDQVDPEWRDKVSDFDRNANLVVMYPSESGAKYFTIPVSWGIRPIKVMADYSYDASNGKATEKSGYAIAGKVLASIWDAYNPVGGNSVGSALMPSIGDIPYEIRTNEKWSGSMIHPEDKKGVLDSENYFHNKAGVPSDKSMEFDVAKKLTSNAYQATNGNIDVNPANLKYAFDGYLSGLGRAASGVYETVSSIAKGTLPQASDAPFARRFYKTKTDEEIAKVDKLESRDSIYETLRKVPREDQPKMIQEYLNSLPADQREGAQYGFSQEKFNTKGTTSSDDIIRITPVFDQVRKLESEGKEDEAQKIVDGLSDEDYKAYRKARTSETKRKNEAIDEQIGSEMEKSVARVKELEDEGKEDDAQAIVDAMTDEEYAAYKRAKKRLGIE